MNVATLTMPKEEAKARLRAYRKSLHTKADAEFKRIEACYRELARERPIINVEDAIRVTGVFDSGAGKNAGFPKLAIAAASATRVLCRSLGSSRITFHWGDSLVNPWSNRYRGQMFHVDGVRSRDHGEAMVPIVPPEHRPEGSLDGYHILFEANWTEAPRDPYLLKRIGGPLFAVIAEWDLTEVERAVMNLRSA